VKILASGFGFPEGPVVMPDGSVILTEIRNGRCSRVTADGKSAVFSECGGGPNGLAIGPTARSISATTAAPAMSRARR
jgi:gluconolactonase